MITLDVETNNRQEMVRITRLLAKTVQDAGWKNGTLTLFVPHTTAGITINENADPDVVRDLLYTLERLVPTDDPNYRHVEGNSAAHVKASLVGFSQTVIVRDGRLVLGTWQDVIFAEFDGPRRRQLHLEFTPST
ncbi:MAG: secondary thiamine-phosphate synthase enzyme YjbQ [Chloroflexota bacterium]|jgi:secondary thiamine-phosphate synthase enzyme